LRLDKNFFKSQAADRKSKIQLFIFSVRRMATAATTKLFELQPVRRSLFIFCRNVIAFLTLGALQNYIVSRHNFLPLY